jgi:two-component system cell cycle sensor histidine kinase/response regulator CckA
MVCHRPGDPPFADIMQFKQNTNRAAHLLRRLIGECIDLRIAPMCGLKPVKADESQLEQAVVNLIVNSRDAMGGKDTIQVRTYNDAANEPRRKRNEVMPARKFVLLEVDDSRTDIAKNLDRVVELFFWTRDVSLGAGLWLYTVYCTVKKTEGFYFVDTAIGVGTKFSIHLPTHDGVN